jgi:hypothetical protein
VQHSENNPLVQLFPYLLAFFVALSEANPKQGYGYSGSLLDKLQLFGYVRVGI